MEQYARPYWCTDKCWILWYYGQLFETNNFNYSSKNVGCFGFFSLVCGSSDVDADRGGGRGGEQRIPYQAHTHTQIKKHKIETMKILKIKYCTTMEEMFAKLFERDFRKPHTHSHDDQYARMALNVLYTLKSVNLVLLHRCCQCHTHTVVQCVQFILILLTNIKWEREWDGKFGGGGQQLKLSEILWK